MVDRSQGFIAIQIQPGMNLADSELFLYVFCFATAEP